MFFGLLKKYKKIKSEKCFNKGSYKNGFKILKNVINLVNSQIQIKKSCCKVKTIEKI